MHRTVLVCEVPFTHELLPWTKANLKDELPQKVVDLHWVLSRKSNYRSQPCQRVSVKRQGQHVGTRRPDHYQRHV